MDAQQLIEKLQKMIEKNPKLRYASVLMTQYDDDVDRQEVCNVMDKCDNKITLV